MTLNEIKENIAESANKDWYLNYEIHLNYSHIQYKISLKGIPSIYEFILKQIDGYYKFSNLPEELERIKQKFEAAKTNIISLVNNKSIHHATWESNLMGITNNNPLIFLSNLSETKFIIKNFEDKPLFYKGVYEYFTGQIQHINNRDYFIGYLLAYEFESKDYSSMVERKDLEKKSIKSTLVDFQNKLAEAELQMTEYLSEANLKVIENAKSIDNIKNEKEDLFSNWFKIATEDLLKLNNESIQKIKDFEGLYKEKLKLEAPAKYWSDRAKKLNSEGNRWLLSLLVALLIGVGLLIWCLSEISAGTLDNIFQNNGTAIKWSVVFILLFHS